MIEHFKAVPHRCSSVTEETLIDIELTVLDGQFVHKMYNVHVHNIRQNETMKESNEQTASTLIFSLSLFNRPIFHSQNKLCRVPKRAPC